MKWFGMVAYRKSIEVEPGVWENQITEQQYFGDILRNRFSNKQAEKINEDITVSNQISIVADPFLLNNFHNIIYITFGGAKWTVGSVEVQYPRLILDLGPLYLEDSE